MILSDRCTLCDQEVRTIKGTGSWHHREDADHNVRFGGPSVHPAESRRLRNAWLVEHGELTHEDQEVYVEPIPEPELRATPVEVEELPLGPKRLVTKARAAGWDARATRSRGPNLHGEHWTVTGVYDALLVRLSRKILCPYEECCSACKGKGGDYSGPCWDCQGTGHAHAQDSQQAVAQWRLDNKGKWAFKFAWTWTPGTPSLEKCNSAQLAEKVSPREVEEDPDPAPPTPPAVEVTVRITA